MFNRSKKLIAATLATLISVTMPVTLADDEELLDTADLTAEAEDIIETADYAQPARQEAACEPAAQDVTAEPEQAAPAEAVQAEPEQAAELQAQETAEAEPEEATDEATEEIIDEVIDEVIDEATEETAEEAVEQAEDEALPTITVGDVKISLTAADALYEGDIVTLSAVIPGGIDASSVEWEYRAGSGDSWRFLKTGTEYTFAVSVADGGTQYRVVLTEENGNIHYADARQMPTVLAAAPVLGTGAPAEGEPTQPEEADEPVQRSVTVHSSASAKMKPGDTVYLTSELQGFDDVANLTFQWECDQGDGFQPVPGATGSSWSFTASAQSLSWQWRLSVSF